MCNSISFVCGICMIDLFKQLQNIRVEKGKSLEDISGILRIDVKYLKAIEEKRFDDLPENVYAIGFLKNYCEFFNMNPALMINELKKHRDIFVDDLHVEECESCATKLFAKFREFVKKLTGSELKPD